MELRQSILRAIVYFDLFHYPLAVEDICRFLDTEADASILEKELRALVRQGCLYRTGPYYSLRNDPGLAEKRRHGEALADDLLLVAARNARLLYQFPYVLGVCVSGSLSKRCADDRSDIDYFIITKANRLWIARTLMHVFKKLSYIRGRQHLFCMNYFVDEQALEIREKNIFTATELLTLMPMSGNGGLDRFFEANNWTSSYLPHYRRRHWAGRRYHRASPLKRLLESLLDNRLGNVLEERLRLITDRRWKKKTERGDRNGKGDTMAMQCSVHYSRPDPDLFQKKILAAYHRRLREVTASTINPPAGRK